MRARRAFGIVLDLVVMVVPSLLLAREIRESAPAFAPISEPFPEFRVIEWSSKPAPDTYLGLIVVIVDDGFRLLWKGSQPGVPVEHRIGGQDYGALELEALHLKNRYHTETSVSLRVVSDVSFEVVIDTMEALRGSECELPTDGSPVPDPCHFFECFIEPGDSINSVRASMSVLAR
jgi:hypothetical protein